MRRAASSRYPAHAARSQLAIPGRVIFLTWQWLSGWNDQVVCWADFEPENSVALTAALNNGESTVMLQWHWISKGGEEKAVVAVACADCCSQPDRKHICQRLPASRMRLPASGCGLQPADAASSQRMRLPASIAACSFQEQPASQDAASASRMRLPASRCGFQPADAASSKHCCTQLPGAAHKPREAPRQQLMPRASACRLAETHLCGRFHVFRPLSQLRHFLVQTVHFAFQ